MEIKTGLAKKFYHNYKIVALLPVIAVIIDYALTFLFADDSSMILSWEASPFVRFALMHNIMAAYLIAIILFYYLCSYAVLRILDGTDYYRFGVLLIAILSFIHIIGGMSWHFRNAFYSNGVFVLSLLSIVIAIVIFSFSLLHERRPARE
jgi:hypothetical protein